MSFTLPLELCTAIDQVLQKRFRRKITDSRLLAEAVLKLSDHYTENGTGAVIKTPWEKEFCQVAYLSYYLPLNFLRNQAVVREAQRVGFLKAHFVHHIRDFGAGLGAASFSFNYELGHFPWTLDDNEQSTEALSLLSSLREELKFHPKLLRTGGQKSMMGVFSYSLTELEKAPAWVRDCEALLIVEPSTREQSRSLIELRSKLLEEGFYVWAPCTHQEKCPMLTTPHDFCHDRVLFEAPDWFTQIEQHLPMKNKSLTFSYLLMGRQKPDELKPFGRLVGDSLHEKGKTRQMVCFGPDRQFLTWMHRNGEAQTFPRGRRVLRPTDVELKSNEIRVKQVQLED